jgi:hypothetical protein
MYISGLPSGISLGHFVRLAARSDRFDRSIELLFSLYSLIRSLFPRECIFRSIGRETARMKTSRHRLVDARTTGSLDVWVNLPALLLTWLLVLACRVRERA